MLTTPLVNLLKAEMEMNMRLIGATKISDLNTSMIDSRALAVHTQTVPADTRKAPLSHTMYGYLLTVQQSV